MTTISTVRYCKTYGIRTVPVRVLVEGTVLVRYRKTDLARVSQTLKRRLCLVAAARLRETRLLPFEPHRGPVCTSDSPRKENVVRSHAALKVSGVTYTDGLLAFISSRMEPVEALVHALLLGTPAVTAFLLFNGTLFSYHPVCNLNCFYILTTTPQPIASVVESLCIGLLINGMGHTRGSFLRAAAG